MNTLMAGPPESRNRPLVRNLLFAALVGAGLVLIAMGAQRWLERRAAAAVVDTFLQALRTGDRDAALSVLLPDLRTLFEHSTAEDREFWKPNPGIEYRIHNLELDHAQATAQMWIEKDGFIVKPIIHLRRNQANRWKISGIDNLQADPQWEDLLRERSQDDALEMKQQLEKAFADRPGVSVERSDAVE